MEIRILSALWGYEEQPLEAILDRIAAAGYDGVDTFMPDEPAARKQLLAALRARNLCLVVQQHQAQGESFDAFKASFLRYLELSAEGAPLLINSHTGRDYFSFDRNLELADLAASFSARAGIPVVHETHRGRFLYAPAVAMSYFEARPALAVTADLSHWVVVSESFLEGFPEALSEVVRRAGHIHARVGYEEGPQVTDPRAPGWAYAVTPFLGWWDRILEARAQRGEAITTLTAEFGPPPYMHTSPLDGRPLADLFEVNRHMLEMLRDRYRQYAHR